MPESLRDQSYLIQVTCEVGPTLITQYQIIED